jgi:hypothetical protein
MDFNMCQMVWHVISVCAVVSAGGPCTLRGPDTICTPRPQVVHTIVPIPHKWFQGTPVVWEWPSPSLSATNAVVRAEGVSQADGGKRGSSGT